MKAFSLPSLDLSISSVYADVAPNPCVDIHPPAPPPSPRDPPSVAPIPPFYTSPAPDPPTSPLPSHLCIDCHHPLPLEQGVSDGIFLSPCFHAICPPCWDLVISLIDTTPQHPSLSRSFCTVCCPLPSSSSDIFNSLSNACTSSLHDSFRCLPVDLDSVDDSPPSPHPTIHPAPAAAYSIVHIFSSPRCPPKQPPPDLFLCQSLRTAAHPIPPSFSIHIPRYPFRRDKTRA